MYVILKHGGKQYKAAPDEKLILEKIDAAPGDKVDLNRLGTVLFLSDNGRTSAKIEDLKELKVAATVLEHFQDDKVIVFKYKSKKDYRRKRGHRQLQTRLLIDSIGPAKAAKSETKKVQK